MKDIEKRTVARSFVKVKPSGEIVMLSLEDVAGKTDELLNKILSIAEKNIAKGNQVDELHDVILKCY